MSNVNRIPKLLTLAPYEVLLWGERTDKPFWIECVQAYSEDEAKEEALKRCQSSSQWIDTPAPRIARIEIRVAGTRELNPARRQHTLFEELADACVGQSLTDIQGAAVNLLITAVQRRARNLADAEQRWDELMGRGRVALQRRYRELNSRDEKLETEIAGRLFS